MHPRTLFPVPRRSSRSDRRPPAAVRRPAIYLGVAASGALVVNLVVGTGPAAQAEAAGTESVSVSRQLGLEEAPEAADVTRDLGQLSDLAASRSSREDARATAQFAQAAADQAVLDRQRAEAEAAARKAAQEAAARQAAEQAAAQAAAAAKAAAAQAAAAKAAPVPVPARAPSAPAPAAGLTQAARSVVASARARVSNSAGPLKPRAQAAADAVVSNVPGAGSITLGGTRASATDPGGHPSGLAVDYMVMANGALGNAIVAYHVANWNALGVEYLIYKQRMLSSPGGAWKPMADRGSATANHMDHPHVNYR